MDREGSISYAKKYLEDTLSFFGLNIDVKASADEDVIELKVPSTHLNGFLIGHNGDTLRSLQFLVSTTLRNHDAELHRINIDIADYKAQRADRLVSKIKETLDTIQSTGEPKALEPMNAADRRVVHQAVSEYPDLQTMSEGEGRDRHIVISKK
ncbi:MAG: R3H domain-containing nucleic acid-binding protein [Candidatus Saccharibacteria bacterium]|nr:R3H domain-containing nucleic acid-binding protein [Candidatus Saccharibacteria bacterium]